MQSKEKRIFSSVPLRCLALLTSLMSPQPLVLDSVYSISSIKLFGVARDSLQYKTPFSKGLSFLYSLLVHYL